jgi:hypothetical protein
MNFLQVFTLILFAIDFVGLFVAIFVGNALFGRLEKKYPKYYERNGRPTTLYINDPTHPLDSTTRSYKGLGYVISLVFKGLPHNLPSDLKVQRFARIVRRSYLGVLVTFPIMCGLFIYLTYYLKIAP